MHRLHVNENHLSTIDLITISIFLRYEYFGKGFGYGYYNNLYQDCGITIREPTDHDFGIWRCLVNIKDKSMHEGSILHVKSEPDASRKVTIESKVYVQQGSSFKVIYIKQNIN